MYTNSKMSCLIGISQQLSRKQSYTIQTYKLESNFCMEFPKRSRNSPGVRFFIFVIQRFNLLLFLLLAEFGRVGEFEEFRSKLYQPFWVHCCHFSHVFFGCKHQLVIDNPVNIVKLLCMLFIQNITFIFKQPSIVQAWEMYD